MYIHYNDKVPVGYVDNQTAYLLKMTKQKLDYQVGVYKVGDHGIIPPHQESNNIVKNKDNK